VGIEFTNSMRVRYYLLGKRLERAAIQSDRYRHRYYWSTELDAAAVEGPLVDYDVIEGLNGHPLLLPKPFVQGEWRLRNDILGEVERIQGGGRSWLLQKTERDTILLLADLTDLPGDLPGDSPKPTRHDYTLPPPIVFEPGKTTRPAAVPTPSGIVYFLHRSPFTMTGPHGEVFPYYWSTENDNNVVEPPPGYKAILSRAGQPLLVPEKWLQSGNTFDPTKEAGIGSAQQPGHRFLLPEPD
jgi:hypothetical protein